MSTQYASRAALATAWLVAQLPAVVALPNEQIVDGPPSEANLKSTCVILGDITHDQNWAALGARNRDENTSLQLTIYVLGPGQTQTAVNESAYALLALIEIWLRNNISAAMTVIPGLQWIEIMPKSLNKQPGDNARLAYLDCDIKYFARI